MSLATRIGLRVSILITAVLLVAGNAGYAGTTGSIRGRTYDATSKAPIAGADVTATSPSQTAKATSNATGGYVFVSLSPDTYTLTIVKTGYNTTSKSGITVLADQEQDVDIPMQRAIATLGRITTTASNDLLKPGTTSDVYSINSSTAAALRALGGPGGVDQAYSAMAAVPGINLPQGQQGWYQTVYIRGGDQDQVGWELDGIPANRSYDNAPMTMVSNIGQQELQVYTGGTLATADASGIAGYVNQVIKRGTNPPFADIVVGIGFPSYYNKASVEFGGVGGRFSYYGGFAAVNQNYRYINSSNGAGTGGYFYPLNVPTGSAGVYAGGTATFAPGQSYGIYQTRDRENVVNLHYSLPHGVNSDDIQFLYLTSELWAYYYSSIDDLGGPTQVSTTNGGQPIPWSDGTVYTGPVYKPVNTSASLFPTYIFPSSAMHQPFSALPETIRDGNDNGVAITKLQYQRNFDSRSYLRVFGYSLYSNWFINGPVSAFLPFGAEVADYELPLHQYGANITYSNQLSDQHLLTASAFWTYAGVQRYSSTNGFPGSSPFRPITNYIDAAGNCYNAAGNIASCFDSANRGFPISAAPGAPNNPMPFTAPGGSPAALAGAQWVVTENGYRANLNQVDPETTALAISDNWKASDRMTITLGAREEKYVFHLPDTVDGYPARPFWFAAYNREFCLVPGVLTPQRKANPADTCAADFPGSTPVTLTNQSGGSLAHAVFEPRFGITYAAGPSDVFRGSWGIFARPPDSRDAAYNTVQQDLATFVGVNLVPYGYTSPQHDIKPDTSSNADLSWEHGFHGSDVSFKLTPFYRSTQNQLQQFVLNPLTGLFGSLNVGTQTSTGVEFALNKGNFSRDGWSAQLAYTYIHSTIKYSNFQNGRNVIDNLNTYITQYNAYTQGCVGLTTPTCSATGSPSALAFPCFTAGVGHSGVCAPGDVTNPYFTMSTQPLFDRNGAYTTYDLIPAPFFAANGYETPSVASLIVGYKRGPLTITPSVTWSSGAKYGSPLSWPGYAPDTCASNGAGGATTPSCSGQIFIPDVYTGKFDNLGAFNEPSRLTANLQIGYKLSPAVTTTLTMTGLVDTCNQRGYVWDYSNVCVYSSLPSGILAPAGNFSAAPPVQLKYPYAMWLNNNNTGFVGTRIPFQAALTFEFKPSF